MLETRAEKKMDRKVMCAALLLLLASLLMPLDAFASKEKETKSHVVLISIDGFLPQSYLSVAWARVCPTLSGMRKVGGCVKGVTPAYPSQTYPGHASIVTGEWPLKHKVYANNMFDPMASDGRGFLYADDLKSEAIWDAAHADKRSVATLSWPSTAGSPSIDWNLPEIWNTREIDEMAWIQQYSKPELLKLLSDNGCAITNTAFADSEHHDETMLSASQIIIKKLQPELMLVHFLGADKEMHHNGRSSPGLRKVMSKLDGYVDKLIEATKEAGYYDHTTFMVVGDHGFADIQNSLRPNVLLAQEGLIKADNGKITSWKAIVHNTGGSAAVYLSDPSDKKLENRVKAIFEKNALDENDRPYYRIVDGEEASTVGAPKGPSFFLETDPPNGFSGSYNGNAFVVASVLKGNHGFYPTKPEMATGLVTMGPHIRKGAVIDKARLVDVAPTVAMLLGVPWPETEGKALASLVASPKQKKNSK